MYRSYSAFESAMSDQASESSTSLSVDMRPYAWRHPGQSPQRTTTPIVWVAEQPGLDVDELIDAIRDAGWRAEAVALGGSDRRFREALGPSCVIIDASHGNALSAVLQWPFSSAGLDGVPVICITGPGDVATAVRAMKAGAIDVLARPIGRRSLMEAIRHALDVSAAALRQDVELRQLRDRHASLSIRERQVMALVVSGLLNKQVGGELGISEITVKAHRGRVMRKMQARSLAALITMAASLKSADPGADPNA